ncbi:PVC-type heme-binding CxxCH protein [Lunatibacter salilacus]|uniref:PVC-type heme-binding CxxCH protein n=1 Tax=Lunatibacter salilacus TaxID=2483804 RepID=UPI001F17D3F1|nr:PVC-type heme-binding CxxCH protein [Lunatibacter salilacus]
MACILLACQPNQDNSYDSTYVEEEPDPIYAEHVRTTKFQTPEEEMASFELPPGFEVTLFASEPDITKPINIAFDDQGRLWVTQSSEYPIKAGQGEGTDRISILEDTNGDGKADKIIEFANDLNIPIGIIPVKDGAIGYSIPNVYRFYDLNGDGKSEKKDVLIRDFEHKDTHGMVNNLFRGLDGWIHASHGFSNISTVSGSDGDSITMTSGNTFRFRQDGSRVEKTTDGRINPFGSDLDKWGYHYSADCHTLPIYQLIWGGNYTQWGKKDPVMGFAPTMMDYGLNSTALSGLVYYTDTQFPEEYQNSFYSGDVVTCRVSRSVMDFTGTTPTATRKRDFLVSKDPWFRPVDIKIGPDGAMYIADFYNSIIGHYEVPLDHPERDRVSGRIWKITYKGKQRKTIDWSKANVNQIIKGMDDEVLQTRMAATDALVDYHETSAPEHLRKLESDKNISPEQRVQTLWALFRIESLTQEQLLSALKHNEPVVRVHAHRILANFPSWTEEQTDWALAGLSDDNPHVKRAAAEGISRHPHPKNYRALIEQHEAAESADTHLLYTLKLALFNHMQQDQIIKLALAENWSEEPSNLLAMVLADTDNPLAGQFLFEHLREGKTEKDKTLGFVRSIAKNLPENQLKSFVDFGISASNTSENPSYQWARAIEEGFDQRGKPIPDYLISWFQNLSEVTVRVFADNSEELKEDFKDQLAFAINMAGKYKFSRLSNSLKIVVLHPQSDDAMRGDAALALMRINPNMHLTYLGEVMNNPEGTVAFRQRMANSIGQVTGPNVRKVLGIGLKGSPIELQTTIAANLVKSPEGKTELLNHIREGDAPARILKARNVEESFLSNASPSQIDGFTSLTENLTPISEERQQLIAERIDGFQSSDDALINGKTLYEENCSICHQVNDEGGLIGPQLDGVGNWGIQALATKVLDPNRNISENFRTYNIRLNSGEVKSGLFRREEGQVLVMADQSGNEFTIPKNEISEQIASKITLMPDTFSNTLDQNQFNDLMTYLLQVR